MSQNKVDDSADNPRTLRYVIWAMTVILGISLATNVWLAFKNKRLSESAAANTVPLPRLQVGATVSPLKASDISGRQQTVFYNQSALPVVLYVFTPECIWCARNLDNLRKLVAQKNGSYRFVGLSLAAEKLETYVAENRLTFPVYSDPSDDLMSEYKLGATPQTIVISSDGRVLQNWTGAYVGPQQAEVEHFFGVELPGLTSISK